MTWLGTWENRRKITIDNAKIDNTLSNFPVLIYLSPASGTGNTNLTDIFHELNANRKKIAVTISDGITQCYVEIEQWDNINESASLWIKVPAVSDSVSTELYIYYDSSQSDNTTYVGDVGDVVAQNVWDSNFKLVMHMAQNPNGDVPNAIKDSTSNINHGTPAGSMTTADLIDGKIGNAIDFDGINDNLRIPDNSSLDLTGQLTVEACVKTSSPNTYLFIAAKNNSPTYYSVFDLNLTNGLARFLFRSSAGVVTGDVFGTNDLRDGNFHYIAGSYDATDIKIYVDLYSEESASATAAGSSNDNLTIGARRKTGGDYEHFWDDVIDEVRISDIARSLAWKKATRYSNWDSLILFGSAEPTGGLISVTLPMITAEIIEGGMLSAALPSIIAELQGGSGGFLEATLPAITAELDGGIVPTGDISAVLPAITAELKGAAGGFMEATLPAITADIKSGGQLKATLPAITASLEGDVEVSGDLIVSLPAITANLEGKVSVHGDLICILLAITAELTGTVEVGGNLACTLPMITAGLTGFQDISGDLVATLPMITALIEGTTGLADDDGDPIDADECGIILRYSKVGY